MMDTFLSGGVIMWPLLLVAVAVVGLAARMALRLRRSPPSADVRAGAGAVLFWGGMAALLGLLGTVVGLVQMVGAIGRAGGASGPLVWGGVGVSLVSFAFGLSVFILAAVAWVLLDRWSARVLEHAGPRTG